MGILVGAKSKWFAQEPSFFNSLSHVIFAFRLFLGMVMYANEVATKENKNYVR